jgi:hypothetical protein
LLAVLLGLAWGWTLLESGLRAAFGTGARIFWRVLANRVCLRAWLAVWLDLAFGWALLECVLRTLVAMWLAVCCILIRPSRAVLQGVCAKKSFKNI